MKKYILLVILFFIAIFNSYSQEIIEYKGDTVIAITPQDLRTINTIIVEYECNLKELDLRKQQNLVDSALIVAKDSNYSSKNIKETSITHIFKSRNTMYTTYISITNIIHCNKTYYNINNHIL